MDKVKIGVRNDPKYKDSDLKTEAQWRRQKKALKENAIGVVMYPNGCRQYVCEYYSENEVRPFNAQELAEEKEKNRIKYQERKEREKKEREEYLTSEREESYKRGYQDNGMLLGNKLIEMALSKDIIHCDNPSKIICFDTETTGLSSIYDEIIQLSIVDGDDNILFDSYVKPYWNYDWEEARAINGIRKEDLVDAPYPHEIIPIVRGIFESASLIVGYNVHFDLGMIQKWGITPSRARNSIFDVMFEFAEIYGEWNDYYESYKWQKLTTCAAYYGYDFEAHNSADDARATLYCYKEILKSQN